MAGECGCGLSSLGSRIRGTMLDMSNAFTAGGGSSINLDKAKAGVPPGKNRYLDYVDIVVTASLTTATTTGAVTAQGWFELIQQVSLGHNIWGQVYGAGITGRQIRLLYKNLNGHLASPDPAAMGAGAGPTTARFLIRIPFNLAKNERGRDISIPIHTLPRVISITFGTAALVGTDVTINSVTIQTYAFFHDSDEAIMPDPWEVQHFETSSANIKLPGGDVITAFLDKSDESFTIAQWGSHTVLGYDPMTKAHEVSVLGWNANFAEDVAQMLTPNAAQFMPLIDLPGDDGQRSVRETHGDPEVVAVNRDSGTLSPIAGVIMFRKPSSHSSVKSNFKAAFPAYQGAYRKTKSKRPLSMGAGNGVPLKGVKPSVKGQGAAIKVG